MLVPIIMCVFIGKWLDGYFGTNGILLIIFIILGVGAGFRSVYDLTKSFCEEQNDKEHRFANPTEYMNKPDNTDITNGEKNDD
jgi:ATP synthase protein I